MDLGGEQENQGGVRGEQRGKTQPKEPPLSNYRRHSQRKCDGVLGRHAQYSCILIVIILNNI